MKQLWILSVAVGFGILKNAGAAGQEADSEVKSPVAASEAVSPDAISPLVDVGDGRMVSKMPKPRQGDADTFNRQIDTAVASLAAEPSLMELRTAALAEADAGREASARWKRGSRLSSMLPTLKISADFNEGRDEALDRYQDKPDRWGADTDRGFGADVSLQWKLDRLVFNTDELKVYDTLADRAVRRENLTALLINVYYERRRLQLEMLLLPPTSLQEALDKRMRIEELGRTIDALTGGLLSSKMSLSKRSRP